MSAISQKELSEIIVKAIQDEPYFSKDVLIPKIKALISGFKLSLSSANYEKTLTNKDSARLIRANELHNLEKEFWKQHLKKLNPDKMQHYYDLLDIDRLKWKYENPELLK